MLELVTIKDVKLNIGRLVREQRLQHELSQDELAAALNISRLTVRKLEAGSNVTVDTLLKVLNHFDMLRDFNRFITTQGGSANLNISLY